MGLAPAQLLRGIPLLAGLPEKELARLAGEAEIYSYEPGAAILRQGEFNDKLYVVLAGKVETSLATEKGARLPLERLGVGDLLGRLSATSDGQNMASAFAVENTHLIAIGPGTVRRIADEDAQIAETVRLAHLKRTVGPALRMVPLFAEVGNEDISKLIEAGRLRAYAKGQVVFEKGGPGDSLYLVVSGVVKVYIGGRILAYLKSGACFGEMALVKNEPRMASAAVVTDVETFRIEKAAFDALLESSESVEKAVHNIIEQRERENRELAEHPERQERLRFMENLMGGHDVLAIDLRRCVRCDKCVQACAAARGQARFERKGDFHAGYLIATVCRQCSDPACMLCKRGAIGRDKTGEIYIKDTCIGCGFCAKQCPYGNIMIVEVEEGAESVERGAWSVKRGARGEAAPSDTSNQGPTRKRKKAAKCDLCRHLDYPPCAFNCPTGALRRVAPEELFLKGMGKR